MSKMYATMDKNIEDGIFDPMDLLDKRLDQATGPSCEVPKKYEAPSDEITSREA